MIGKINRRRPKKIDYNKFIVTSFCNILYRVLICWILWCTCNVITTSIESLWRFRAVPIFFGHFESQNGQDPTNMLIFLDSSLNSLFKKRKKWISLSDTQLVPFRVTGHNLENSTCDPLNTKWMKIIQFSNLFVVSAGLIVIKEGDFTIRNAVKSW